MNRQDSRRRKTDIITRKLILYFRISTINSTLKCLDMKSFFLSFSIRALFVDSYTGFLWFGGAGIRHHRGCYNSNQVSISRRFGGGINRDGLGKPKGYSDVNSRYVMEKKTQSGLPRIDKCFTVLGIESSCDDTGVSIVRSDGKILSNIVYSQYQIHEKFGGIVPSLAMEAHKFNIDRAVVDALLEAGFSSIDEVDAIAVTKGPGLEICLRVGFRKAQVCVSLFLKFFTTSNRSPPFDILKAMATEFKKPFVTVHHLEAHCIMARLAGKEIKSEDVFKSQGGGLLESDGSETTASDMNLPHLLSSTTHFQPKVDYPFLTLLASGGHTSILICKELGEYQVLGGTLDDALGEAFDKAARLLGLKSATSGGAAVELAALTGNKNSYPMTVPMRNKPTCDFSYAGIVYSSWILHDDISYRLYGIL